MSDMFLQRQAQVQEQKLEEEKKIKQRQESADLLNRQMQQTTNADAPNALETSMLMSQKADLSEVARLHKSDVSTGLDDAMASPEFKLESSRSKERTDVLKKHAGLKGQEKADYIKEYNDFYNTMGDN